MRLIDADLVVGLLKEEKKKDDCIGLWYSAVCGIIRLLESAPTVEVKERKTGEWIACNDSHLNKMGLKWECTNCKTVVLMPTRYCHSCGAEMRR